MLRKKHESIFAGRWELKNPLNAPAKGETEIPRERFERDERLRGRIPHRCPFPIRRVTFMPMGVAASWLNWKAVPTLVSPPTAGGGVSMP